jgi:hypothetical protein
MAWTTPRTWVAAELVTASLFNTHIRDNENAVRDYLLGAQDLGNNSVFSSGRFLLFKDTDVAHGITTAVGVASFVDTNTWLGIGQRSSTAGGAYMFGLSDTDTIGNTVWGINGSATPTAPGLQLGGSKKNGAATQVFGSTEEVIRFNNDTTTLGGWYGLGLNVAGGLSVGYTGAPASGFLSVGDANLTLGISGGIVAQLILNSGGSAGVTYSRTTNLLTVMSDGDAYINGANVRFGLSLIALGGGAAPTLGTIGGGGPATAAQNTWIKFKDVTGTAFWVPVWK